MSKPRTTTTSITQPQETLPRDGRREGRGVRLNADERKQLADMVGASGLHSTAALLGVSSASVVRALADLTQNRSTRTALRLALRRERGECSGEAA